MRGTRVHKVDRVRLLLRHEARLFRHGELVHLELAALSVRRVRQRLVDLMALAVEGIVGVVSPNAGHHARRDERSAVVDMPVGHLRVDPLLDPDDLLDAQVLFKFLGHVRAQLLAKRSILARIVRPVPGIRLIGNQRRRGAAGRQQARIGDDDSSLAVDGDGATLEDHVVGTVRAHASVVSHLPRNLGILVPREVQAVDQPAVRVEIPVRRSLAALAVHKERRPRIAEPRIVDAHLHHGNALVVLEHCLAVRIILLIAAHDNGSESRDGVRNARIGALGGHGAEGKRIGPIGPAHIHAILRGELSRHVESICLRRGFRFGDLTHFEASKRNRRNRRTPNGSFDAQ